MFFTLLHLDNLLIDDRLWRVEHFLLLISEASRLAHETETENEAKEGHACEVPDGPVDLKGRVNHEFKGESDQHEVDELGPRGEARRCIHGDLGDVQPRDTTLGQLERAYEETQGDKGLQVPAQVQGQSAKEKEEGHGAVAEDKDGSPADHLDEKHREKGRNRIAQADDICPLGWCERVRASSLYGHLD